MHPTHPYQSRSLNFELQLEFNQVQLKEVKNDEQTNYSKQQLYNSSQSVQSRAKAQGLASLGPQNMQIFGVAYNSNTH